MRRFLIVLEIADDGYAGDKLGEQQLEPVYILTSEKKATKYLLQNWKRDAGIVPTIMAVAELIP